MANTNANIISKGTPQRLKAKLGDSSVSQMWDPIPTPSCNVQVLLLFQSVLGGCGSIQPLLFSLSHLTVGNLTWPMFTLVNMTSFTPRSRAKTQLCSHTTSQVSRDTLNSEPQRATFCYLCWKPWICLQTDWPEPIIPLMDTDVMSLKLCHLPPNLTVTSLRFRSSMLVFLCS